MRSTRIVAVLCVGLAACPERPVELIERCDNRVDDDQNGKVDCLDPACSGDSACAFGEDCTNGIDDNSDLLVDCADPFCEGRSCGAGCICRVGMPATDGGRSDGGTVEHDAGSPDAGALRDGGAGDAGAPDAGSPMDAGAGADAGRVDAGSVDAGSVDAGPLDGGRPDAGVDAGLTVDAGFPPETACGDGLDNDLDGLTDCADPTCVGSGPEVCSDGVDNTCDRAVDCGDPKCLNDSACRVLDDGAACSADVQCKGGKCLTEAATGHPNGACTSSPSCDIAYCQTGLCVASARESFVCRAWCTSASDCRPGYACDDADNDSNTADAVCVPLCVSDLDCAVSTTSNFGCNLVSKRCEVKSRGLLAYGADCTSGTQCESGQCAIERESNGQKGSCSGLCRNDLLNCGPEGLCSGESLWSADNVSSCQQSCTDTAQCRAPGFQCRERIPGDPTSRVCACLPLGEYCGNGTQCCSGRCFHAQCEAL